MHAVNRPDVPLLSPCGSTPDQQSPSNKGLRPVARTFGKVPWSRDLNIERRWALKRRRTKLSEAGHVQLGFRGATPPRCRRTCDATEVQGCAHANVDPAEEVKYRAKL